MHSGGRAPRAGRTNNAPVPTVRKPAASWYKLANPYLEVPMTQDGDAKHRKRAISARLNILVGPPGIEPGTDRL